MRQYAKLSPAFWTGKTGRFLKRRGIDGVVVALYLVSSPHSNMLGLFYQPISYIAEETGLTIEGASKGLRDCIECGFCSFDGHTKTVWVHEMAAWQIAESLKEDDKRCKGIQNEYDDLLDNPFLEPWFHRYKTPFRMTKGRVYEGDIEPKIEAPCKPLASPLIGHAEVAGKPHRSQEHEQEHEQEHSVPNGTGAENVAGDSGGLDQAVRSGGGSASNPLAPTPAPAPQQVSLLPAPPPPPPQPVSARDVVFALGIPMLTSAAILEKHARSFLASQCKQHGDDAVAAALEACARDRPIQPIPWLQQRLKPAAERIGKHTGFDSKNYREGTTEDGHIS